MRGGGISIAILGPRSSFSTRSVLFDDIWPTGVLHMVGGQASAFWFGAGSFLTYFSSVAFGHRTVKFLSQNGLSCYHVVMSIIDPIVVMYETLVPSC